MPALALTSPRRSAEAGITLIEVLVVLAVIGVAAGATMLGVNASERGSRAETEAIRLAQRLSLSVDEAIISGRDHLLIWDDTGYRFERRTADGGWAAAEVPILAQRHDLPAPIRLAERDGQPEPLTISAAATGPQTVLVLTANSTSWVVAFDGFTATAMAETAFNAAVSQ